MNGDTLEIRDLYHSFNDEPVLSGVRVAFPVGNLVAILGPSGCGKTTLLRCIAGLLSPKSGGVLYKGESLRHAENRGSIGYTFQSPILLPWRTSLQNVMLPAEILNTGSRTSREIEGRQVLDLVGLAAAENKYPFQLSGGMQQRVGLARALVTKPSLLLLDEPFGALDGITRDRLNETVRRIWIQYGMTIIFVTHSIEEAVYLADEVLILSPKPARVVQIVKISLGQDRSAIVRSKKEFFDYITTIRKITEESA